MYAVIGLDFTIHRVWDACFPDGSGVGLAFLYEVPGVPGVHGRIQIRRFPDKNSHLHAVAETVDQIGDALERLLADLGERFGVRFEMTPIDDDIDAFRAWRNARPHVRALISPIETNPVH